jgi:hypothetical protein
MDSKLSIIARRWVARRIFPLIESTGSSSVWFGGSPVDYEITCDSVPTLRIETRAHTISVYLDAGSIMVAVGIEVTDRRTRTNQAFYLSGWGDPRILDPHLPTCKLCQKKLKVEVNTNFTELLKDDMIDIPVDILHYGHSKYHQKIASRTNTLFVVACNVAAIIRSSINPIYVQCKRFEPAASNIPAVMVIAKNWYSRLIFQCIWSLRKNETCIRMLPRDIFRMISEMIYTAGNY